MMSSASVSAVSDVSFCIAHDVGIAAYLPDELATALCGLWAPRIGDCLEDGREVGKTETGHQSLSQRWEQMFFHAAPFHQSGLRGQMSGLFVVPLAGHAFKRQGVFQLLLFLLTGAVLFSSLGSMPRAIRPAIRSRS